MSNNDLNDLADSFKRAGARIAGVAAGVVHVEGARLEGEIRQFDGESTQAVVTYPAPTTVHIQGTETFGVSQSSSPVSAIDAVDVPSAAGRVASSLAAAGAKLIGHG